ncbi:hypothetical protein B0H17DRAFT_1143926 [Mycena rosella]|uniref:Uncharacterized protein n=1 Tax=Mycena rosella TaxID=1033263 RepID=A0AAD7CU10_MYCRO|nr:hypothetical protein B0H17DRAFT_1143926 [Mycena rosella]
MQFTHLVYLAVVLGASTFVVAAPAPDTKFTIDITVHQGDMQAGYADIDPISCQKNSECPYDYGCWRGKSHEIARPRLDILGYLAQAQGRPCNKYSPCPSGYYCDIQNHQEWCYEYGTLVDVCVQPCDGQLMGLGTLAITDNDPRASIVIHLILPRDMLSE